MKTRAKKFSLAAGYKESLLPSFTNSEKSLLKGSYDYIGINHYSTLLVQWKSDNNRSQEGSVEADLNVNSFADPSWPTSVADMLAVDTFYSYYYFKIKWFL